MQFPNAPSACDQDSISKGVLAVIDDEPFSRECLIEAMHGAFLETPIIGLSSVDEVQQIDRTSFALVLLRGSHISDIRPPSGERHQDPRSAMP